MLPLTALTFGHTTELFVSLDALISKMGTELFFIIQNSPGLASTWGKGSQLNYNVQMCASAPFLSSQQAPASRLPTHLSARQVPHPLALRKWSVAF